MMQVVLDRESLYSMDNRRLALFRLFETGICSINRRINCNNALIASDSTLAAHD